MGKLKKLKIIDTELNTKSALDKAAEDMFKVIQSLNQNTDGIHLKTSFRKIGYYTRSGGNYFPSAAFHGYLYRVTRRGHSVLYTVGNGYLFYYVNVPFFLNNRKTGDYDGEEIYMYLTQETRQGGRQGRMVGKEISKDVYTAILAAEKMIKTLAIIEKHDSKRALWVRDKLVQLRSEVVKDAYRLGKFTKHLDSVYGEDEEITDIDVTMPEFDDDELS